MRITILPPDGNMGIDGEFYPVDLSDIDPAIHAVQWDDAAGEGHVEFKASATVAVQVRDAEAEGAAGRAAGKSHAAHAALRPIMKTVQVRRDNEALKSFGQFQKYVGRWNAAKAAADAAKPT